MFFLNRTSRSGILNGGIIGGRNQKGPWKIDARFNAAELAHRIAAIAGMKKRISLTQQDALSFLRNGIGRWSSKTLIYLDPPYYVKGRDLYYDFYEHEDHVRVADLVKEKIVNQNWMVSYDDVPAIRGLYDGCPNISYNIGYSARTARQGSEVMFFCSRLRVPQITAPMRSAEEALP
jgi:DNA adenine methylase